MILSIFKYYKVAPNAIPQLRVSILIQTYFRTGKNSDITVMPSVGTLESENSLLTIASY